jgi:hypothetical protein
LSERERERKRERDKENRNKTLCGLNIDRTALHPISDDKGRIGCFLNLFFLMAMAMAAVDMVKVVPRRRPVL